MLDHDYLEWYRKLRRLCEGTYVEGVSLEWTVEPKSYLIFRGYINDIEKKKNSTSFTIFSISTGHIPASSLRLPELWELRADKPVNIKLEVPRHLNGFVNHPHELLSPPVRKWCTFSWANTEKPHRSGIGFGDVLQINTEALKESEVFYIFLRRRIPTQSVMLTYAKFSQWL